MISKLPVASLDRTRPVTCIMGDRARVLAEEGAVELGKAAAIPDRNRFERLWCAKLAGLSFFFARRGDYRAVAPPIRPVIDSEGLGSAALVFSDTTLPPTA